MQTVVPSSRSSASFCLAVLLQLADAALQSASEATQLRCIRVLLLEVPNHPLDFDSASRMCEALHALGNSSDVSPTVQQAVKLLLAVLGSTSSLPLERFTTPRLPSRFPAPAAAYQRFASEHGVMLFEGPSWVSLRACNSAFMIDISTVPYSTLGHAFETLQRSTVRTIEDDPLFGGHLLQQLPDDSELIELESKWLQLAALVNAQPSARGDACPSPPPMSPDRKHQELLLPEGVLMKLMGCLTTSKSECEATLKASSILAKVLADRCVYDKTLGITAVSSCLHEILVSSFFSAQCCFTVLYNITAHLVIMECNSMHLSEELLGVLHSLLQSFWVMTRRVPLSSHSSLSNQIRHAWSCAANLLVHFVTAGGFVIQPLVVSPGCSRSLFILLDAARCYGLPCHSALCRLLFLSLSAEPELLLALVESESTLVIENIQISGRSKVLGWLLAHMSHCPVGQSRDCLFVLLFKIIIAPTDLGQEPLDASKSNALLSVLLKFRLSSVLHVFSGHFPTDYSESICRWLFKAMRSNPVENFDKSSAIDFFCSVERSSRLSVDIQSTAGWPASLFVLPHDQLALELHALSVAELRIVENFLCQLWFHHCESADTSIPSRDSRPFVIVTILCSLSHHMACAFLVSGLLKYSVSHAIFRCSRGSSVEHGMSCSFELINSVFLELFVPSDSKSSHCFVAVLSGVLDLISKLIMVHPAEGEAAPLSHDLPLPALFLERKLQVLVIFFLLCPEFHVFPLSRQIPLSRLQQLHPPILQVLCANIPRDLVYYRRTCAIMAVSLASIRLGQARHVTGIIAFCSHPCAVIMHSTCWEALIYSAS